MEKGRRGRACRQQKVWPRERCLWINQLAKARSLGKVDGMMEVGREGYPEIPLCT